MLGGLVVGVKGMKSQAKVAGQGNLYYIVGLWFMPRVQATKVNVPLLRSILPEYGIKGITGKWQKQAHDGERVDRLEEIH